MDNLQQLEKKYNKMGFDAEYFLGKLYIEIGKRDIEDVRNELDKLPKSQYRISVYECLDGVLGIIRNKRTRMRAI